MKLWLDDMRLPPDGSYMTAYSVKQAIGMLIAARVANDTVEVIDLDHDLGNYARDGGDGIKLLDWCIENNFFPPVRLHTMNPVGYQNMQRTIQRYWK